MSKDTRNGGGKRSKKVTIRDVAAHLGLSPATVSVVLNRAPVAKAIPQVTQDRVFEAVRRLGYHPNQLARSLRSQRSRMVGVLVPEALEPYGAGLISGIERFLIREGYFYLVASHQRRPDLIEKYLALLEGRRVDGLILLATDLESSPGVPTVAVAGHSNPGGISQLVLDHDQAAHLALAHLDGLGHRRIALVRGPPHDADTKSRWEAILGAAERLQIEVSEGLVFELSDHSVDGPARAEHLFQQGLEMGRQLLNGTESFTALVAFDDLSALGAIRAFVEAGRKVPEEISVVGFDDILTAAVTNPALTTIKQPLSEMGELAASRLLKRLAGDDFVGESITMQAKLIVRESTGPAPVWNRRVVEDRLI